MAIRDGSDTGELVEIRRLYVQNGQVIHNAFTNVNGKKHTIDEMVIHNSSTNINSKQTTVRSSTTPSPRHHQRQW